MGSPRSADKVSDDAHYKRRYDTAHSESVFGDRVSLVPRLYCRQGVNMVEAPVMPKLSVTQHG